MGVDLEAGCFHQVERERVAVAVVDVHEAEAGVEADREAGESGLGFQDRVQVVEDRQWAATRLRAHSTAIQSRGEGGWADGIEIPRWPSRSGSSSASIRLIFPPVIVKDMTEKRRPFGATTAPAAPLTSAGNTCR